MSQVNDLHTPLQHYFVPSAIVTGRSDVGSTKCPEFFATPGSTKLWVLPKSISMVVLPFTVPLTLMVQNEIQPDMPCIEICVSSSELGSPLFQAQFPLSLPPDHPI